MNALTVSPDVASTRLEMANTSPMIGRPSRRAAASPNARQVSVGE